MANRITEHYESRVEHELKRLRLENQPDEISLGESQEYELSYLQSHRDRFRQMWDDIPNRTDLSILDIGPTPFTFLLNNLMGDGNVATIDYTDLMKDRCEDVGINHVTHDLHQGTIPFDEGHFDVITFHGVLEHLFTPANPLLEGMAQTLDGGGRLLLGTPNFARLENRAKLLAGVNPQEQIEQEHVHGRGHVREYTLTECVELVEQAGLTTQRSERRHYISFPSRIQNAVDKTALGGLPFPADYLTSTMYYSITAMMDGLQYHNYVVATK